MLLDRTWLVEHLLDVFQRNTRLAVHEDLHGALNVGFGIQAVVGPGAKARHEKSDVVPVPKRPGCHTQVVGHLPNSEFGVVDHGIKCLPLRWVKLKGLCRNTSKKLRPRPNNRLWPWKIELETRLELATYGLQDRCATDCATPARDHFCGHGWLWYLIAGT